MSSPIHYLEEKASNIYDRIGIRFEAWPIFFTALAVLFMAYVFMPVQASLAFQMALFLAPLWLPFLLAGGAYDLWYVWKRSEFIASKKYILLEIKPPRNLVKTPLAMETFLSTLHLTGGEPHWYARAMGGTRAFWSLEIASFEGQVHFYLWGRAEYRRMVESQIYAQYPGAQITEAVDYTRTISATTHEWSIWGCSYAHTNRQDPLPIKTYIDFGLDKVQKEPEQVDPLAQIIEFMGALGKGEYLWLQFVIRAHKGEKYHGKVTEDGKAWTWKDEAAEMVKKIREKTRDTYIDVMTGEERPGFPNPTKGQMEMMAAIERNVSKLAFDVGGRAVYLAKPENFKVTVIHQMITLFKPFNSEGWNGIKASAWLMRFNDYPWEIALEKKKDHYRHELVEAYRRRQFFYDPFYEGSLHIDDVMVMSTEELATIYHIPSRSVEAPGLGRVASAVGEAPSNLPI